MKLLSSTVEILKYWNQRYPKIVFDSKFVKRVALNVFGLECVTRSSALDTRQRNSTALPLDPTKLNFVRGNYYYFQIKYMKYFNQFFPSFFLSLLDLFGQRIGTDTNRAGNFITIINKHCGNAKRD